MPWAVPKSLSLPPALCCSASYGQLTEQQSRRAWRGVFIAVGFQLLVAAGWALLSLRWLLAQHRFLLSVPIKSPYKG
jgi:hypothetical protein